MGAINSRLARRVYGNDDLANEPSKMCSVYLFIASLLLAVAGVIFLFIGLLHDPIWPGMAVVGIIATFIGLLTGFITGLYTKLVVVGMVAPRSYPEPHRVVYRQRDPDRVEMFLISGSEPSETVGPNTESTSESRGTGASTDNSGICATYDTAGTSTTDTSEAGVYRGVPEPPHECADAATGTDDDMSNLETVISGSTPTEISEDGSVEIAGSSGVKFKVKNH